MGAAIKGTPNTSTSNTVTIPTHAVGDDIFIFAFRDGSTTVPSKPSASGTVPAWVDIESGAGANSCSARLAHFVATATNHTSGTWTNATGMIAVVIQNQASSPIGGHAEGGGTSSTLATAPSITQQQTTGKALILEFYGHRTVTAWSTAPSGYTRKASNATEVCLNSKDLSTSDGSISQNCTTSASSGYRGITLEILSTETSPTIALNSPADASSGSDTTPDLQFTGTDSESDDVTYQIQVDTASTFNSQSPTLLASYSESNNDDFGRIGVDFSSVGECFDSGNGGIINSCEFEINKVGSPTGNIIAAVYAITGTFGTNATPTGSELAHSDNINVSTLPTSRTVTKFTFTGANKIELTPNTKYFVILYWVGGDASNYVAIWADTTSPIFAGNFWDVVGGGSSGLDLGFYFYIDTPLINKFSASDVGFSNSASNPLFSDNFNDNSLDGAKWSSFAFTSGSVSETNQRIELSVAATTNASESGLYSGLKDFRGKRVSFEVVSIPTGNCYADVGIQLEAQTSESADQNYALIGVDTGTGKLQATHKINNTFSLLAEITYNSTSHKYWAVREEQGIIYYEYSADRITWTTLYSESTPFSVSSAYVLLDNYEYNATSSPTAFKIDNVSLDYSGNYPSAEAVTYTVQSALSLLTYYWKVRAKDPSGSNLFGSWSSTRSFTITSGSSSIKTAIGLSKSSIKSLNGLAIASVKSINGLS